MTKEAQDRHWPLLTQIASARETLDPKQIVDLLADDAAYESQDAWEPIVGKKAISDYLMKRFRYFASNNAGAPTVRLRLGIVDLPEASNHPCLVFEAHEARQALWALRLDDNGRLVKRLDILTVAPPPDAATLLDEAPVSSPD